MDPSNHKQTFNVVLNKEITPEQRVYLDSYPEIHELLKMFVSNLLINKPVDANSFAKEYFSSLGKNEINYKPLVLSGPSGVGKVKILLLVNNYS